MGRDRWCGDHNDRCDWSTVTTSVPVTGRSVWIVTAGLLTGGRADDIANWSPSSVNEYEMVWMATYAAHMGHQSHTPGSSQRHQAVVAGSPHDERMVSNTAIGGTVLVSNNSAWEKSTVQFVAGVVIVRDLDTTVLLPSGRKSHHNTGD